MTYGQNPNETYMSDSGSINPKCPVIYLCTGPYAIWWTGTITGVIFGDDAIAWIAPVVAESSGLTGRIHFEEAVPIEDIESWEGTIWAHRPNGPSAYELLEIAATCRNMTVFATKFSGNEGF